MLRRALAAAIVVVLTAAVAGCSSTEDRLSVAEGTPVTLDNLSYNVQISRYLKPAELEDQAYLKGAPPLARDEQYLGVFLQVHNHGSTKEGMPSRYEVTDTEHNAYQPVPIDNDFALPLGGVVGAGGRLPNPETIAANGPIDGSMLLFLIPQSSAENRPLTLKIPAAAGGAPGRVELDL
jgi:hypothetical protein